MVYVHNNNSSNNNNNNNTASCPTECAHCDMTRRRSVHSLISSHLIFTTVDAMKIKKVDDVKEVTSVDVETGSDVLGLVKVKQYVPKRWVLAFALCFMRMCHAALRQNMGFALVCMNSVEHRGDIIVSHDVNLTSHNGTAIAHPVSAEIKTVSNDSTEFRWTSAFEGQVLSAPYYGFLLVIPFAGYLDHALGSRRLLVVSLLLGGTLSLLTPILTRQHPYLLVALRALTGCATAVVKPAVFSLFAHWTPVPERGVLTSVEYTGSALGGIITFFISGFLCSIPADRGWTFVFYVFGAVSLFCAGLLTLTVHNSPSEHPRISKQELNFISNNLAHEAHKGLVRPPWGKMLSCPAVWAIVIANVCYHWVFAAIVGYLPMYMKDVLGFPLEENGMLSALPFLGSLIIGLVGGVLVDRMQLLMSTVLVRKTFQLTGSIGFAIPMFVVSWLDSSNRIFAVILLIGAVTLLHLTSLAFRINSLDIAPGYASYVTSMSFTVATAVSLTAPVVTSLILQNKTQDEWQKVLYIVTAVSIFGGIFYVIFARGNVQPWACEHSYDVTVTVQGPPKVFQRANSVPDDFRPSDGELAARRKSQCVILSVAKLEAS